ncbi:MAG: MFS transporter [Bacteroidota bacterium]
MTEEITDTDIKKNARLKTTFAALQYPNYRLWFWGQMISLLGSWMQTTAQGFLVFELTHSPVFLGYVGFASGVPSWIFTIYGGVIADRFPRRTILVFTQSVMMLLALLLAFMTFTGVVTAWSIVVLAFGLGIANAFDAPARQAFVTELIEDRKHLVNAIALNSTMFNSGTAIGPAVAGITYAAFGPAWCFIINGISFIGVIAALLLMKLKPEEVKRERKSAVSDLKEGITYLKDQKLILTIMMIVLVTTTFGISFATLMPAWAVKIMHGNAATNGLLQSARGAGALVSALFLASVSSMKFKGKLLTFGTFSFPLLLLLFSFIRWLPASLLCLAGIGAASLLVLNLCNGLTQTTVSDEFRGRVLGIYSMNFFGFLPLGALLVGTLAEHFSEPGSIIICSVILLIFALAVYFIMPKLRQIP